MLFQELHIIQDNFEKQSRQHILGYSRSVDTIKNRMDLFANLNNELIEIEKSHVFESIADEIRYYKYEKPKFQKYGIFYNKLLKIELHVPMGSQKIKTDYYEDAYKQINMTFIENQDYIVYYRMRSTDRDENLFVRNSPNNHIFALIEATSMMEEFLYSIDDERTIDEKINDYPRFTWTGKLTNLVILVKGLVLSKSINNGSVSTKELVEYFQVMFNVDLKDHYRKYQDVKNSQDPTKFLDYLIELIKDDINDSDEKFNQKK